MSKSKMFLKALLLTCALGIAGCGIHEQPQVSSVEESQTQSSSAPEEAAQEGQEYLIYEKYVAYMQAANLTPLNYEQWLATIKGEKGDPGKDGTKILSGTEAPSNALGAAGDFFINITNWDFYLKENNAWVLKGNIKGPQGSQGPEGAPGQGSQGEKGNDGKSLLTGEGAPEVALGENGDSYINLSNWDFYVKESGEWVEKGNIKGPQGDPGDPGQATPGEAGSAFRIGNGAPLATLGANGDNYLDYGTGKLYTKIAGKWLVVAIIDTVSPVKVNEVTFKAGVHGGEQESYTALVNDEIVLEDPEFEDPTGYSFDHWLYNETAYEVGDTIEDIEDDIEVEAVWAPNKHTLTYVLGNGQPNVVIEEVEYDSAIVAPVDPFWTGHTFTGWDQAIPTKMPDEDVTITAEWEINKHSITFAFGNGEENEVHANIEYGSAIDFSYPDEPQKVGYSFVEWDAAIPETMPDEDIVINAVWEINKHSITFVFGNGIEDEVHADITYGAEIDLDYPADPEWIGHTFTGWDRAIPETMPDEDVVITAEWETNKHSITFVFDNGDEPEVHPNIEYGSAIEFGYPEDPECVGRTFSNWDKAIPETMPDEDLVITAEWNYINYTITFMNGEAEYSVKDDYHYGDAIVVPDNPTKDADAQYTYAFSKWDKDVPATVTGDMTFNAVYQSTVRQYSVTFYDEDQKTVLDGPTMYDYGATPTYQGEAPAKAADNTYTYTFDGWNISQVTGNQVYYASYTPHYINYTVIFYDDDEETVISSKTDYHYNADVVTPDDPTKDGYTFTGWSPAVSSKVTGNATYVAQYSQNAEVLPDYCMYLNRANYNQHIFELSGDGAEKTLLNMQLEEGDIFSFHYVGSPRNEWIEYVDLQGRSKDDGYFSGYELDNPLDINSGDFYVETSGTYNFYVYSDCTTDGTTYVWVERLTTVTFNFAHDISKEANEVRVAGNFDTREESWHVYSGEFEQDIESGNWVAEFELPIGLNFKLVEVNSSTKAIDVWEYGENLTVIPNMEVTEWRVSSFIPEPINFYIRGAVNEWGAAAAYQFTTSDNENNIGQILGVELEVGDFKVAHASWDDNYEVGYYGYKAGSSTPTYYNDVSGGAYNTSIEGSASGNFKAGGDSGTCNINCQKAGTYNIYLTNSYRLSIVEVA